jgi:hypothetical protein
MDDESTTLLRRIAAYNVRFYGAAYLENRNPVFVWKAYRECREGGFELPTWILEYFDSAAQRLCELEGRAHTGTDMLAALRLDSMGRSTRIGRAQTTECSLEAYQRLKIYTSDLKMSKREAKDRVCEEMGIDIRTLNRYVKAVKDALDS